MLRGLTSTATEEAAPGRPLPGLIPTDPVGRQVVAKFFRALGDPTRLALLEFCASGERQGTECVRHVHLSQGRVAAHLACLVTCGLLTVRRDGRSAFYSVRDPRVLELLRLSLGLVAEQAAEIASCTRVAISPG